VQLINLPIKNNLVGFVIFWLPANPLKDSPGSPQEYFANISKLLGNLPGIILCQEMSAHSVPW
jgi:hypothetical protein